MQRHAFFMDLTLMDSCIFIRSTLVTHAKCCNRNVGMKKVINSETGEEEEEDGGLRAQRLTSDHKPDR